MPGTFTVSAGKAVITVNVKAVKAKCAENQAALDRLQEHMIKAQANESHSNYFFSLRRAVVSLKECRHPITTLKEATDLKGVGPKIATIIVPHATTGTAAAAAGVTKSEDKKKATTKRVAPSMKRQNSSSMSSVTSASAQGDSSATTTTTTSSAKEKAYHKAKKEAQNLELPQKGPWKVILLVDGREHKSKQVVSECKQSGIPCEERHLPIGDMAWIARCTQPSGMLSSDQAPIEIMIGTIIERKDTKDLVSSLFGTRFSEQRLRLSKCGLPQVLFLVEGDVNQTHNCPAETLHMAMMETRIQLGFQVVQTKSLPDTVRVLKGLHRRIVQRTFPEVFDKDDGIAVPSYVSDDHRLGGSSDTGRRRNRRPSSLLEMVFDTKPKPPFGTSRFITYAELKAKVEFDREQGTRSVQAITLAMLKQIPTISEKKCTAIAQEYPTMNRLIETLCFWEGNQQTLISEIPLEQNRTIGPKSGAEIVSACCTLGDGSIVTSSTEPDEPAKKRGKQTKVQPPQAKSSSASSTVAAAPSTLVSNRPATTATTAARSMFPIDEGSLSDDSGFEVASVGSFESRKRPAAKNPSLAAAKKAPVRKTSRFMADLDDSLLMSSPDDFLSKRPPKVTKVSAREAAAAAAEKRAAMAQKPAAKVHLKQTSSPLVIDIADSDGEDGSPVETTGSGKAESDSNKRFESDFQLAICLSMLDTPSTKTSANAPGSKSSLTTPDMPSGGGKQEAARKGFNDSVRRDIEIDDSLLLSSPEQETSLRERLANRLDREVIEIDLD